MKQYFCDIISHYISISDHKKRFKTHTMPKLSFLSLETPNQTFNNTTPKQAQSETTFIAIKLHSSIIQAWQSPDSACANCRFYLSLQPN